MKTFCVFQELEEEHELLTEELRALRVSHIKLQDKLQFVTERSQKSGEVSRNQMMYRHWIHCRQNVTMMTIVLTDYDAT